MSIPNRPIDVFKFVRIGTDAECWPWIGDLAGRDSRPFFTIKGRKIIAYRIVYSLFHGVTLTPGQMLRHSCDNRICCNPHHFPEPDKLGGHAQNMQDMVDRNRSGMSRQSVKAIKRLLAAGTLQATIAEQFGISQQAVSEIATGKTHGTITIE